MLLDKASVDAAGVPVVPNVPLTGISTATAAARHTVAAR